MSTTSRWACPDCGRTFGRARQGHTCSPAMTVADYLETSPVYERPIAEALIAHVATLPDAVVEPVSVGLFCKRGSTFAQLRTMTKWVSLGLKLPRVVGNPTPDRKVQQYSPGHHHHVWNLRSLAALDPLLDLIDEAYEADI